MGTFVKVAAVGEVPSGQGICVEAGGQEIALFYVDGSYYAIDNHCPHADGPLCDGDTQGTQVACPWHGALFNMMTGEVLEGPADTNLETYSVRVAGESIEIEI